LSYNPFYLSHKWRRSREKKNIHPSSIIYVELLMASEWFFDAFIKMSETYGNMIFSFFALLFMNVPTLTSKQPFRLKTKEMSYHLPRRSYDIYPISLWLSSFDKMSAK